PPSSPATPAPPADTTLTNDIVIQMVTAKVSPGLILAQIRSSKSSFVLTPSELIRLTQAGVPDNVIEQMRNPKRAIASNVPAPAPRPPRTPPHSRWPRR